MTQLNYSLQWPETELDQSIQSNAALFNFKIYYFIKGLLD